MLLDTGADQTCFPASFAEGFGHCNDHPDVVKSENAIRGISGFADSYLHSVQSQSGQTALSQKSGVVSISNLAFWHQKVRTSPISVNTSRAPQMLIIADSFGILLV